MIVELLVKMWCLLVLCPVLLAAGTQTLTIDSQLGTSIEDCFERISIGEQLPNNAIYRNVSELTTRECEQICKQDKQCQAYDYGVGAKGNATCDLSNLGEKKLKEKDVLNRHPDYDVYIRRFQCEQSPPSPLQPQHDEEGNSGGPTHRPVFRPEVEDPKHPLSDDFPDLRPFETTRPDNSYPSRPYKPYKPPYLNHVDRPDDYNSQGSTLDRPPSYGIHKPQDIPYRPERPYQNQSQHFDPYDVLQFQERPQYPGSFRPDPHYPAYPADDTTDIYGPKPIRPYRPGLPPYRPEQPEFVYINRPIKKPLRPQDEPSSGYGSISKPSDYPTRPDPYGPSNDGRPPYKPTRPMDYPYRPNNRPNYDYQNQYASNYGQNQYNDNSIYLEIYDPPRPYRPSKPMNDRPGSNQGYGQNYGYGSQSDYGSYDTTQSSYSQNTQSQYQGTITQLDSYNRPQSGYRPKPQDIPDSGYGLQGNRPEKPYEKPSTGYGLSQEPIDYKPQKPAYSPSSSYGGSSQSNFDQPQASNGYGPTAQKPQDYKPSYNNQPSNLGSYGGSQSSGNHGYGNSQTSYNSGNRPAYSSPQDYNQQSSYNTQFGSYQESYGVNRPLKDKPSYNKPYEPLYYDKPLNDRPYNIPYEKPASGYGEKPIYNRPLYNDRPAYNRPIHDLPYDKPSYDRPERPDKPLYDQPIIDTRPNYGSQASLDRPSYDEKPSNSYGQPPFDNNRPDGDLGPADESLDYKNARPKPNQTTGYSETPSIKPVYEYETERPNGTPSYIIRPNGEVVTSRPVTIGDYLQKPGGYEQKPVDYGQNSGGYGQKPVDYGHNSGGYGQKPVDYGQNSGGYVQKPVDYGQNSGGYRQKPDDYELKPGDYGQKPAYGREPPVSYKACFRRVLAGKRALRSFVRRVAPCERLEDCRRECAEERRFHCESFNYRLDPSFRGKGLCEMMTKPIEAFDVHRDFVEDKDYDFYELDRNSLEPHCPETLRGPGFLHSGFLSSKPAPNRENYQTSWDRNDWSNRGSERNYNRFYDDRNINRKFIGRRRHEDQFYVPYQIGLSGAARSNEDENWGQYGGSYGNSYYKDRNDYHKSISYWGLNDLEPPVYGVRPHDNQNFNYHDLSKKVVRYGHGAWKRGRWNTSGSSNGLDYGETTYYKPPKPVYYEPSDRELPSSEEGSDEVLVKDCSSRRRPGMSLGSGAIRRSLLARTVVQCEAACFNEREFKCVSYSYRYSNSHGSDNCFLSERPYRGLELAADSGSDVYAMPEHHGCDVINNKAIVESECFWHVRSGAAVSGTAVRAALTVAGLGACEAECIRAHSFFCRGFSFRYDSPTIGDDLENCILTSTPPTSLDTGRGLRTNGGHELYARGNYGRGCEPALYDDVHQGETGECYLQYDNAAKLIGSAVKGQARVQDESACGQACTDAPFRCLSFSYNNNAPPNIDNCLLSEIRLFDLQRGVDYDHSSDDWLFAFDLFNGQCWRKVHSRVDHDQPVPELPRPLSPPPETYSASGPSGPSGPPGSGLPGYLPEPPAETPYIPGSGPPSGPGYKYPEHRPEFKPSYHAEPYLPEPPGYLPKPSGPGYAEPSGPYRPSGPSGPRPSGAGYLPGGGATAPGYAPSGPFRPSGPPSGPPGPYLPSRPLPDQFRPSGRPGRPGYPDTSYGPPSLPGPIRPVYPDTSYGPPALPGSSRPGYRPPGLPGPPGPPAYPRPGDREEEPIAVSWRHYTVSGFPCRQGTTCAQNQVAGHWACEPEGGEIGSWDYCCAPTHRCGYSEGFHKPWCYVGPSQDQWRPCSEKYYPYHQHNIPHPSQGHPGEVPRPLGRPLPESYDRPDPSYLPEADRRYWDDLYKNGPQAYYDQYGNPLPGYTRVPTADRPHIIYRQNSPRPGPGHWVPVSSLQGELAPPGGLGVPRYWPVAYLHKGPPPNTTYFKYNQTERPTAPPTTSRYDRPPPTRDSPRDTPREPPREPPNDQTPLKDRIPPRERPSFTKTNPDRPSNNNIDSKNHRDEKTRNITTAIEDVFDDKDKDTTTTPKIEVQEVTEAFKPNITNTSEVETVKTDSEKMTTKKELDNLKGIDDKIDDFSSSIEVLDIEDAKKGEKLADLKTLEAEERQIEAIGRLVAARRGGKLVIEKRSQKDLETKNIALDKDLVDFNFGNRFSTPERRGTVQRVTKDEIEKERNVDKSLEVSETTFVRPPRVLSTTDNIRKAIVNGKVFYSASVREQRDLINNSTRKAKSLRPLEERAPSVLANTNFGKKKVIRTRNVNPVRKVRRVYRRKYNPDEVRRRLLERERSMKENAENKKA